MGPASKVTDTMTTVLLLNGPNLDLLGKRNPGVYGSSTLADVELSARRVGSELGIQVETSKTNSEGGMVDEIHRAGELDGLIINPGAYGHYSLAIRDAIEAVAVPCVEVHISNIYAREQFRHTSVISPVVKGVICGLGVHGYELALRALADLLLDKGAAGPRGLPRRQGTFLR